MVDLLLSLPGRLYGKDSAAVRCGLRYHCTVPEASRAVAGGQHAVSAAITGRQPVVLRPDAVDHGGRLALHQQSEAAEPLAGPAHQSSGSVRCTQLMVV